MFSESIFPWIVLDFNTSKGFADWVAAIGPTSMACIAVGVAIWQGYVSNKQKKLNQQQIEINKQQLEFNKQQREIQRCGFIYSSFIKEKQDKLLELRKRFLEFKDINMLFLSILFPCSCSDKKQEMGAFSRDIVDISEEDFLVLYYIDSQEIPKNLIEKASKINAEFFQFLVNNEIFVNDNPQLYLHLHQMTYGFGEFFKGFIAKKDLYEEFTQLLASLIKTSNFHTTFSYTDTSSLKKIRQYFYITTRYSLCISEKGENSHILYKAPSSLFNLKKLKYNEREWAESDKIAFFTHSTFLGWFNTWRDTIDGFFSLAFSDIKRVQDYAKK